MNHLPSKRVLTACASLWLLAACGPRPNPLQPPPLDPSSTSRWTYAAYLLGQGDPAAARAYLEPIASGGLDGIGNPALLLRDLAEARLFSGDAAGAASAASQSADALAQRPTTAQFRADDRTIFAHTLTALSAAGNDDIAQLQQLTVDDQPAPSADAWYLLGWLEERHGDVAAARLAYARYLVLAPRWAFLREARAMRSHAQTMAQ